ncbi:hypothetical protein ACHQM5_012185 [Ranunculus cassubicifolius]
MSSNTTLVCTPLMADSVSQMLIDMEKAKENGADLVELRIDYLKEFYPKQDLEKLIKESPLPNLITYMY